ncbi:MAG: sulfatase-like hydrolase/transferase [Verrucomicrobia bacterium]|nr:sulfatase-like hydrolase/transferase [Verrucomicrobiota bacterium]
MIKQQTTAVVCGMALALGGTGAAANAPAKKPNILYIVADDMGYADCGVHGCKDVPTPNLDALAAGGIRFTDGYVTGTVCSPSRAALMTARYHYRDGVYDWIPAGKPGLNTDVPTVAGYLKKAGYRTAIVGKWHLGEQEQCHPLKRGFDEFYGFLGGGRSYFPDKPRAAGAKMNHYSQIVRGAAAVVEKEYTTHAFTREAVDFLARQKGSVQPFFLYLAFNAVHTPMEAPDDYLARFPGIGDKNRRIYAGMLAAMDDGIGRVLKAVREAGIEDNTLICFISDNGGPITRNAPNASLNTPLRGGKGETWEGGIRVPFFMQWKGRFQAGATFTQPVIQMDITATVLALAGVQADADWPIDGVNLLPFIEGNKSAPHATLCWEYEQQWAIREGQWKLTFAMPDQTAKTPVLGLYDLSNDISEAHDLSQAHPERVRQLQSAWTAWHKRVVGDKPGPEGKPKAANNAP